MSHLSFALFGAGRIGCIHFKELVANPRACVTWVVEADVARARKLVSTYHLEDNVQVADFTDVQKVLDDSSIDAVLICTPHHTHEELISISLKAGKPVFCEKPLSLTVPSVVKCYEVAESVKLPLMCGFNRRYDRQNRLIYNRIRNGDIGKVRVFKATSREPRGSTFKEYLKESGGIFLDALVHDIDISSFFVGELPVSVYAQGHATNQMFKDCSDVDSALVTLKFPGGAIACLDLSRDADLGSYYHRVEVLGNNGLLETGFKKPADVTQWRGAKSGGIQLEPCFGAIENFMESFKFEIEHFIDVLTGKCELEITGQSTILSNIIAAACKTSLDTHQEVDLKTYAKEQFNYIF